MRRTLLIFAVILWPVFAFAEIIITEVMYDLPGADTGREWIEIKNTGNSPVDLLGWKFFEDGINHGMNSDRGGTLLSPGDFAVIVDDPQKFLIDWPNYTGIIFDSAFSLLNTGGTLGLKNGDAITGEVTYSSDLGANGDGNSLQINGTVWLYALPTPGALNATNSAHPPIVESDAGQISDSPSVSGSVSTLSTSQVSSNYVSESKITARIKGPASGIVGADLRFEGEAFGLKKEPLDGARFLWNFGDGILKDGQYVTHIYNFPSEYTVVLEVVSGEFGATSRQNIKIVSGGIRISAVKFGENGFVEIQNDSSVEINLSDWILKADGSFIVPKNTLVPSGKEIIFANAVTRLSPTSEVFLLFPGGREATKFVDTAEDVALIENGEEQKIPRIEEKKSDSKTAPVVEKLVLPKTIASIGAVDLPENSGELETGDADKKESNSFSAKWLWFLASVIIIGVFGFLSGASENAKRPVSLEEESNISKSGDDLRAGKGNQSLPKNEEIIQGFKIIDISDGRS